MHAPRRKWNRALQAAALVGASASLAQADTYYWDGTATSLTTLTGWSTSATTSTPDPTVLPGSSDDVIFGTSGVVANQALTANANLNYQSLNFNNSTGLTFVLSGSSGNRNLTVGAGGLTVAAGHGTITFGNTASGQNIFLRLGASQTWTNYANTETNIRNSVNAASGGQMIWTLNAAGSGNLGSSGALGEESGTTVSVVVASSGTGLVTFGGGSWTGGTTVLSGTLRSGGFGTGAINVGDTVGSANTALSTNGNVAGTIANAIFIRSGSSGLATLTSSGSGAFTFTGTTTLNKDLLVSHSSANFVFSDSSKITGVGALTKAGTGILTLAGSNDYAGGTTLSGGTVRVNAASAVGSGLITVAATTTLDNTSGGAISLSSNNLQTWNSNITFTGTNDLDLGTGDVFLGTTSATNSARILNIAGGKLTVRGVITDGTNATPVKSIHKTGAGTLALTGLNEYTGVTSIGTSGTAGGTLEVTHMADATQASSIGTNGTISFGGTTPGGSTLRYVGASTSTNRTFSVGSVGARFDASGTGAIHWTNAASPDLTPNSASKTITLKGTNTGANTFSTAFHNPSAGDLSFLKEGEGKWVLAGNNTFRGDLTINGGTLRAASNSATGFGPSRLGGALGTTIVNPTGTLDLAGGVTVNEVISLNGASLTNETASTTATLGNGVAGLVFSSAGSGYSGTATVSFSDVGGTGATATAGISGGAVSALTLTSAGSGFSSTAPTVTITGSTAGSNAVATAVLSSLTLAGSDNTIGGAGNLIIAAVVGGNGGFTKVGAGTVQLTGVNTYTGATSVTGGKLDISGSLATSTVAVAGATLELDTNESLIDAASLNLDTGAVVNLNFAEGNEKIAALSINGVLFDTPTIFNAANNYNGYGSYFTSAGGGVEVVPEPASLSLLSMAAGGLLARRKRRA